MSIHYGACRMAAHWNGNDPDRTKAYWAVKLHGVPSQAVSFAMANLPQIPPNIDEFLAVANRAPRTNQPMLVEKATPRSEGLQKLQAIKRQFPRFDPASYPKPSAIIHETTEVPAP